MIFCSGFCCDSWRVAAKPLRLGMPISRITTSGLSFFAISTASRPILASPHISHPTCVCRRLHNPCRTTSWSSAIKIRSFITHLREGKLQLVLHMECIYAFGTSPKSCALLMVLIPRNQPLGLCKKANPRPESIFQNSLLLNTANPVDAGHGSLHSAYRVVFSSPQELWRPASSLSIYSLFSRCKSSLRPTAFRFPSLLPSKRDVRPI